MQTLEFAVAPVFRTGEPFRNIYLVRFAEAQCLVGHGDGTMMSVGHLLHSIAN